MTSGPQEEGTLLTSVLRRSDAGVPSADQGSIAGTYPTPAHHGSEPVFHHIEVACVRGTLEIRRKGGRAVSEAVPVKAKEERMLLEIACSIPAQARLGGTQQLLDEIANLVGDSCVCQR